MSLLPEGNNYYLLSSESGTALLGAGLSAAAGSVQQKALESSNVDVALEFTRPARLPGHGALPAQLGEFGHPRLHFGMGRSIIGRQVPRYHPRKGTDFPWLRHGGIPFNIF